MYELSAFLGKEETLRRMQHAIEVLGQAPLSSPEGDTNVQKTNEAPSGAVRGA